jgi:hypothetical protein
MTNFFFSLLQSQDGEQIGSGMQEQQGEGHPGGDSRGQGVLQRHAAQPAALPPGACAIRTGTRQSPCVFFPAEIPGFGSLLILVGWIRIQEGKNDRLK